MKSLFLILVLIPLFPACARWTKADTALEVTFVSEQILDESQTSEAVVYCGEANEIVGHCGQNVSPQAYFLTTTLLHVFIAALLPRYWRESFQGATVLSQGLNTYGNVSVLRANRQTLKEEAR